MRDTPVPSRSTDTFDLVSRVLRSMLALRPTVASCIGMVIFAAILRQFPSFRDNTAAAQASSQKVTGPSFTRHTCISAPKRPPATRSTRPSACPRR